jgi:hypothetical protein
LTQSNKDEFAERLIKQTLLFSALLRCSINASLAAQIKLKMQKAMAQWLITQFRHQANTL